MQAAMLVRWAPTIGALGAAVGGWILHRKVLRDDYDDDDDDYSEEEEDYYHDNTSGVGSEEMSGADIVDVASLCDIASVSGRSGGEGEPSSPPASLESIAFQTDAQVTEPETPQSRPVDTESLAKMVDLTLARDAERTRAEEERARAQAQQERALDLELKLASALSEVEATKKMAEAMSTKLESKLREAEKLREMEREAAAQAALAQTPPPVAPQVKTKPDAEQGTYVDADVACFIDTSRQGDATPVRSPRYAPSSPVAASLQLSEMAASYQPTEVKMGGEARDEDSTAVLERALAAVSALANPAAGPSQHSQMVQSANNNANQYVAQTPTPPAQQYSQGNPFAVRPSLDAMPQSSEANVINFQPISMMGQGMNMQQQGVPRDILTS
mmetsp:Transcript_2244/g.4550  ORF Transcript_2244/g.4550 Transcript_2244/m.4550 type:complete len:387 (-) Transcript_2244:876-2036(-)